MLENRQIHISHDSLNYELISKGVCLVATSVVITISQVEVDKH